MFGTFLAQISAHILAMLNDVHGVPQALKINAGIVLQIRSLPLTSKLLQFTVGSALHT
jgi:hypothetical protein